MKIIVIASAGGHWTQLLRMKSAWAGHEVLYVSTKASFSTFVPGERFVSVRDSSRWDKIGLMITFKEIFKIIFREKPDIVITTGAAPGVMAMVVSKFLGRKAIWIDSIANVEQISMSGKIASYFAWKCYTQWPELKNERFKYAGNVLK